ncbi:hypothetical protein : Uncharacterized protein OS=Planctomyces maris DSM 8797 GN=PM8797T_29688 PE=4 SV=1 [Gemmataceae bacterium]|nr:hypothetical protein : Uncharacterized protein OS=Planctomyces maris DSM 8797 GN=PM8797T_29688 PE=4 SV=1 [Gemmataceae bacterium]VTU01788.1 hypothetical protein : Uncharacterized protein OS=Planctomyces maris DSM 8797 GN=PM8797T_29688 PE=4 SV=1 [Gemmataceae bacterium]
MRRLSCIVLVLAGVAGCSGGSYAPVTGTVTLRGRPVAGATVVFTPDPPAEGATAATARTGDDGSFRLQTNLPGGVTRDGAGPGKYKVTVSKFVPPGGMTEEQYAKRAEAARLPDKPYSSDATVPPRVEAFPREFSDVSATTVTATVTSGSNEVKIDVP